MIRAQFLNYQSSLVLVPVFLLMLSHNLMSMERENEVNFLVHETEYSSEDDDGSYITNTMEKSESDSEYECTFEDASDSDDEETINQINPLEISSEAQLRADEIYQEDLEGFLRLAPTMIALKAVDDMRAHERLREDACFQAVETFLNRIDSRSAEVRDEITASANRNTALLKWKHVALNLLSRNDLFGYICITSGMAISVRYNIFTRFHDLPLELSITRHNYVRERNRRSAEGLIPAIYHETSTLRICHESISASTNDPNVEQELKAAAVADFIRDMATMQNMLRQNNNQRLNL